MGATIRSFPKALRTTFTSPLLIIITFATLTASVIIGATFSIIPLFGQLIAGPIAATLMAGVLGMIGYAAYENRGIDTDDYLATIKDRGTNVFAVVLIEQLIYFFISLFFMALLFFVFGLGGAFLEQTAQGPDQTSAVAGGLGLGFTVAFVVFVLVYVVLIAIFQFLTVSVVIGNKSVGDSFRTCFSIIKSNPISVVGYTLTRAVLSMVVFTASLLLLAVAVETAEVVGVLLGAVVIFCIAAIFTTFFYAFHAHYYLELPNTPVDILGSNNTEPTQEQIDHPTEQQQDVEI